MFSHTGSTALMLQFAALNSSCTASNEPYKDPRWRFVVTSILVAALQAAYSCILHALIILKAYANDNTLNINIRNNNDKFIKSEKLHSNYI